MESKNKRALFSHLTSLALFWDVENWDLSIGWIAANFDKKWHDTLASPPVLTRTCPVRLFLFSRMKRDLKGKRFADVEDLRGEKNDGSTKRHHQR
jgi:hypothetical protein